MTDYEILKSWLMKADVHFEEMKSDYDGTPIIIIPTSAINNKNCVVFYFNSNGSFDDFENFND